MCSQFTPSLFNVSSFLTRHGLCNFEFLQYIDHEKIKLIKINYD